jgi:2'-5' RNA ligase
VRLFIGVPVPPTPQYTKVVHQLRKEYPEARGVPAGSWHVTLRFLGEVRDPRPVEDAIHGIAARHHAAPMTVRSLGAFQSPRRARIVWAKVVAEGLRELAEDMHESTKDIGQPSSQEFVAHTSLARMPVARNIEPLVEEYKDTVFAEGMMDKVVLFQSTMTKTGPVYRRRMDVPLTPRE